MEDHHDAAATKYAFVTNGVARALRSYGRDSEISESSAEALRRGAAWLLEMQRGTALIASSKVGVLGYTAESIPAARRAFGVVEKLSLATEIEQVQALLKRMEADLRRLAETASVRAPIADEVQTDKLRQFFDALGQSLTEEATAASFGNALEEGPTAEVTLSFSAGLA